MADLSIKNLGIGLASSILAGAISVTAATGVGASAVRSHRPTGSYRLHREQPDVGGRRQRGAGVLGWHAAAP